MRKMRQNFKKTKTCDKLQLNSKIWRDEKFLRVLERRVLFTTECDWCEILEGLVFYN